MVLTKLLRSLKSYSKAHTREDKTQNLIQSARDALAQGDLTCALMNYRLYMNKVDNDLEGYIGCIICHFQLKSYPLTSEISKLARAKFGNHPALLHWSVKIALHLGQISEIVYSWKEWRMSYKNPVDFTIDFYQISGEIFLYLEQQNIDSILFIDELLEILVTQGDHSLLPNTFPTLCGLMFQVHEFDKKQFDRLYKTVEVFLHCHQIDPILNKNTATLFIAFNYVDAMMRQVILKKYLYDFDLFSHWSFILIASGWNANWDKRIYSFENLEITKNLLLSCLDQKNCLPEKFLYQTFFLSQICQLNVQAKAALTAKIDLTKTSGYTSDLSYIIDHSSEACTISDQMVPNQLKIAICVSGQLRGYKAAFESWKHLGLDEHNVSIFVHTWSDTDGGNPIPPKDERYFTATFFQAYREVWNTLGHEEMLSQYPQFFKLFGDSSCANMDELKRVYRTHNIWIDDVSHAPFTSFSNAQKMYYKISECHKHLAESEYDLVIRIRPDLRFHKDLAIDWKAIYQQSANHNTVFTSNSSGTDNAIYLFPRVGVCMDDTFAVGTQRTMDRYTSVYKMTQNNDLPFFPHTYMAHTNLAYNCLYQGLNLIAISMPVSFSTWEIPTNPAMLEALKVDAQERNDIYDIMLMQAI